MVGGFHGLRRTLCSVRRWALCVAVGTLLLTVPVAAGASVAQAQERLQGPLGEELTLESAVTRALLHSADVELARLDVLEAELKLEEARIDQLAGRARSELIEAERALQTARERFVDALADVALQATEAYYSLLRATELAAIARRSEEQAERQFAVAKTRYEAGLIAKHEYDEVELRRDEAADKRIAAEERRDEARRKLLRLVGESDSTALRWAPVDAELVALGVELEAAIVEAEAARREIREAARKVEAAQENLELLRSTFAAPVELRRAELEFEASRNRARAGEGDRPRRCETGLRRAGIGRHHGLSQRAGAPLGPAAAGHLPAATKRA